jgi:hypothetical protein
MRGNRRTVGTAWLAALSLCACGSSGDSQSPLVSRLFINELQPSNQDTITDENGEADDWIELVNMGESPVDMLGLSFADTSGTTQVIASSVIVPPGAFHLFWADDSPGQGPSHLGFKLSGKVPPSRCQESRRCLRCHGWVLPSAGRR